MAKESVNEQLDEFFEYTAKFAQKYPEIGSNFMTLMGRALSRMVSLRAKKRN